MISGLRLRPGSDFKLQAAASGECVRGFVLQTIAPEVVGTRMGTG